MRAWGDAMRASSLCLWIIAHVIVTSLALAESAAISFAAGASPDMDASCRIPFETLKDSKTGEPFPLFAALNENATLPEKLRQRYVVADLSSTNENGYCRGVQEFFTSLGELSEFPRLRAIAAARRVDIASLANAECRDAARIRLASRRPCRYRGRARGYSELSPAGPALPHRSLGQPSVSTGYCMGQTLNLCEIVNGQPRLVYRLVTSSRQWQPPLYHYYAPINFIKSRSWSSDRRYTPADARRDARMGGGCARIVPFANDGDPIEMPNFIHFVPGPGYPGETANGIHQIAGGFNSGGTFGAPVSLGCIRLGRFQAKLARWWTPTQAKFFVHFEPNRYRKFGVAATGKARGFQNSRTGKD